MPVYRENVGAGIKGACPAPLITPQSAQADRGAWFPAPPEPAYIGSYRIFYQIAQFNKILMSLLSYFASNINTLLLRVDNLQYCICPPLGKFSIEYRHVIGSKNKYRTKLVKCRGTSNGEITLRSRKMYRLQK